MGMQHQEDNNSVQQRLTFQGTHDLRLSIYNDYYIPGMDSATK